MRKARTLDPSQPALILTYGSCPGKIRPLDRELLVIGRAPACDLVLNSPEVSPVHCLIIKTAAGWIARNTNPRAGTQVNGRSIQDERLCDDDCLQIGTFTFKLHLPIADPALEVPVVTLATKRLQASRQKVVRLAWNMRRRLLQIQSVLNAERQAFSERNAEMDQRTQAVDARQRECENLLLLLEEQEEEVNDRRQTLLETTATFEAFRRQTEENLVRQAAEAEAYAQNTWEQCQARQRDVEQLAAQLQARQQPAVMEVENPELANLRAENEQLRKQLAEAQPPPPVPDDQTPALRIELDQIRLQLHSRDEELERVAADGRERDAARQAEQTALLDKARLQASQLDEQSRELVVLREQRRAKDEDSQRVRTTGAPLNDDEQAELMSAVETLLRENEEFRRQLSEQGLALTNQAKGDEYVAILLAELGQLRAQVQIESEQADFGSHGEGGAKEQTAPIKPNKYLRLENEQLRELTKSLQQEAAALREQLKAHSRTVDDDADLEAGQQRLHAEQALLEKRAAALLQGRKELDAAAHAAELQSAKERSELTRAWAELNRKREEFRMELEKEKRDNIRDNLERVRRIKEEAQMKRLGNAAVLASQRLGDRTQQS